MAVLVEAISVIVECASVARHFPGDIAAFAADCLGHNRTYCSDSELCRIGFMVPDDARRFVERMRGYGLIYERDGWAIDLVVMDQQRGPMVRCDWAEFGTVTLNAMGARVACARLTGSSAKQCYMPDGWTFEESLSKSFGFVLNEDVNKALESLEEQNGLEVHLDRRTGKKVYIGRQQR